MKMRNTMFYALYSILKKGLPIWFIFLLYLRGKGLSYTQALLLDSLSAGATLLCEVPSGMIADHMSRKRLILIGEILITVNYLVLLLGENYSLFLVGAVVNGIGDACISGTGEALLYDMFQYQKKEEEYLPFIGKICKIGLRFAAVSTLFTSYLYDLYSEIPMIISLIFQGLCLVCIILFKEEGFKRADSKEKIGGELQRQWKNISSVFSDRQLLYLFFLYLIMTEMIATMNYSSQTYLPELGLPIKFLGTLFFVFNMISSFGAKFVSRVKLSGKKLLLVYGIFFMGLAARNLYAALFILASSRFISGFLWPLLSSRTNLHIQTKDRATVLSYRSLLAQIFPMAVDPLIGLFFDYRGIEAAYAIFGIVLLVGVVMYCLFRYVRGFL